MAPGWYASYAPALTPKHSAKLLRYMETILFPTFGGKSVAILEPSFFVSAIRPTEAKGHITTAHKLMQLCSQVMELTHLTGKARYNPATGLSRALQPLRHQNLAAVTEPAAIGQLLRDIDAYKGFPSIVSYLKILPYVFTRPSELRLKVKSGINLDGDDVFRGVDKSFDAQVLLDFPEEKFDLSAAFVDVEDGYGFGCKPKVVSQKFVMLTAFRAPIAATA